MDGSFRFAGFVSLLLIAGCGQHDAVQPDNVPVNAHRGLPTFDIPLQFDPEPGAREGDFLRVQAREFSVMVRQEYLASRVDGIKPDLYGIRHDSMVIVRPLDEEHAAALMERPEVAEVWDSIWQRTGTYGKACVDAEKDAYTGLYRYYKYCDPEPVLSGSLYLMDVFPDKSNPRPDGQGYIRATCSFILETIEGEQAGKQQCKFYARTASGDKFTFRLTGDNLYLWEEVADHLGELIASWQLER